MAIRTLSSEERSPGVTFAVVEVTEPGVDRHVVYEVSCEACDSLAMGLTMTEAQAELIEHDHEKQ